MLNRMRQPRIGALVMPVVLAAMVAIGAPSPAQAHIGDYHDLPNYGSSDGNAKINRVFWTTNSGGYRVKNYEFTMAWQRRGGSYCTYVQVAYVFDYAVDGSWGRATDNKCSSSTSYWYATKKRGTTRVPDGLKFRVCGDKPYDTDPCGSAATIRG